jgi:hypothetical protein
MGNFRFARHFVRNAPKAGSGYSESADGHGRRIIGSSRVAQPEIKGLF